MGMGAHHRLFGMMQISRLIHWRYDRYTPLVKYLGTLELVDQSCQRCQHPANTVFNFPGWMLIMLYATICLLIDDGGIKNPVFARGRYLYPMISMIASLCS
jgi:hypothetical protein